MVEFLSFPSEILHRICWYADLTSRKAVRLVNRRLAEIAQQWVFHCVAVSPRDFSCECLKNILQHPNLALYVNKLYLFPWSLEFNGEYFDYEDEEYEGYDGDEETNLPVRFLNLFDRLQDFPRLQSVALCFHWDHVNEFVGISQVLEFRAAVMRKAFAAFASLPQLLKELTIKDLHNVSETDPTVVADMAKVLSGLRALRLNIINEHCVRNGEMDYKREETYDFYSEIPAFWLKPTTSTLQHLTIYSPLPCGFYPKLDFRGLHFPHLKTLYLGNYGFVHDSQLDWILSHGATLSELYLDECTILYEVSIKDYENTYLAPEAFKKREEFRDNLYASYGTRWADYFRAFKDRLPHLCHFRYGHSSRDWISNATPFEHECKFKIGFHRRSYLVFCDGFGQSPYMSHSIHRIQKGRVLDHVDADPLAVSEDDKVALQELCAKLGQPPPDTEILGPRLRR
ncbi:hypothetical protein BDV18DRAFT_162577 [Aspergillus unguis]